MAVLVEILSLVGNLIAHGSRMINEPAILVLGSALRNSSTVHKANKATAASLHARRFTWKEAR